MHLLSIPSLSGFRPVVPDQYLTMFLTEKESGRAKREMFTSYTAN